MVGRPQGPQDPRQRRRPGTVITPGYKNELGLTGEQIEQMHLIRWWLVAREAEAVPERTGSRI
jgi:hypothetical protein